MDLAQTKSYFLRLSVPGYACLIFHFPEVLYPFFLVLRFDISGVVDMRGNSDISFVSVVLNARQTSPLN